LPFGIVITPNTLAVASAALADCCNKCDCRWAHRSSSELYSGWDSPGIATLYAQWGVDPIAHPPGFDLEAFIAVPQITDAADAQKIAGEDV
jgi:hypothetical protein